MCRRSFLRDSIAVSLPPSWAGHGGARWGHLRGSRAPGVQAAIFSSFPGTCLLRSSLLTVAHFLGHYSDVWIPCVRKGGRKEFEFPITSAFLGILWDGFLDKALILFFLYFQHEVSEPLLCVKLKILSNWGHPKYTCLYRLRVHGTPGDHT